MKTKNLTVTALKRVSFIFGLILLIIFIASTLSKVNAQSSYDQQVYQLDKHLESRSVSFENPTGAKGEGGKTASKLGTGRKGKPSQTIKPGDMIVLCDINGTGTIRHIWMTGSFGSSNQKPTAVLRSAVIRVYWENQNYPSIECPLGDFMGLAHSKVMSYQSAVHSVGENGALNIWLPMPFTKNAKMTLTNEGDQPFALFYQIDYTIGDKHPDKVGRLHTCFRRENPTVLTRDFEILPTRTGTGRYIGTVLGIRSLEANWWGEGEIKIYLDGDKEFPTICGTGSEDYVCLSYGVQQTPFLYQGCSLNKDGFVSMYRWHLPDPVYWQKECRIAIQQIGWMKDTGLYERQDDWSSATFWYEPVPSAPLPPFPDLKSRTADLIK